MQIANCGTLTTDPSPPREVHVEDEGCGQGGGAVDAGAAVDERGGPGARAPVLLQELAHWPEHGELQTGLNIFPNISFFQHMKTRKI